MTETKNYGLHLTVDGYNGSPDKLADVNRMYQFLNELPALIGMHKVGFPHIIQFTEKDIAGISGFQFIMESHISMHTYSNRGFLSFDLYSCNKFDTDLVQKELQKIYDVSDLEVNVVVRGTCFPCEPTFD